MVQAMMEQPWGVVSAESRKNSARVMLETFAKRGIRAAFGIPGGLISPLYDALADVPQIRNVTVRHEGMAGYAAMGHAVATGLPALVMTTSGPGLTNAITGIAAAYVEELPLVVVAGEVPTDAQGRGALQDGSPQWAPSNKQCASQRETDLVRYCCRFHSMWQTPRRRQRIW